MNKRQLSVQEQIHNAYQSGDFDTAMSLEMKYRKELKAFEPIYETKQEPFSFRRFLAGLPTSNPIALEDEVWEVWKDLG